MKSSVVKHVVKSSNSVFMGKVVKDIGLSKP